MRTIDDVLTETGREIREAADRIPLSRSPSDHSRGSRIWGVAAVIALVAVFAFPILLREGGLSGPVSEPNVGGEPLEFGPFGQSSEWMPIEEAPIQPRPYAVSVWTGREALFFAGSSLSRGFAYTDGAAYDPETGVWRELPVPGWGHPGLSGVFFEGNLYLAAKGGASRFDPTTGLVTDLPALPDGWSIGGLTTTEDALWAWVWHDNDGNSPPMIAMLRLSEEEDGWIMTPSFETDAEMPPAPATSMMWTGDRIVVWNPTGLGVSFDPATDTWESIPVLAPDQGRLLHSKAVVAASQLVVVAQTDSGEGGLGYAVQEEGSWQWRDIPVRVDDFVTTTIVATEDRIHLLPSDGNPIEIRIPSGLVTVYPGGISQGVEAPNAVWTGSELVVWGGARAAQAGESLPATAYVWTPGSTAESSAKCTALYGSEPWLILFSEAGPPVPCVFVGVHQDVQVWNKGFDTLRVEWFGREILPSDSFFSTGRLGDVVDPGRYDLEAEPYPAPSMIVVGSDESTLTNYEVTPTGWGPFDLGSPVTDGAEDLGMSVRVFSDGVCTMATVDGDPYSPTFFLEDGGDLQVIGIEVSYPARALIGTDCRGSSEFHPEPGS